MNTFYGTKKLHARRMTLGSYNDYQGWIIPEGQDPEQEGYLVEYTDGGKPNHPEHDGYISWSPKEVFEGSYQSVGAMTFGHALEAMKSGEKVCRAGWNGKGMWIVFVEGQQDASGDIKNDSLWIKQVNRTFSTWVPSIGDCLADDWMLAGEKV